ncbi:toxin-antitoxin system HicB family antitoxin [Streptomyces sp. NPDC002172]
MHPLWVHFGPRPNPIRVYSGCMVNFNLRLPDDLHAAIKAAAERDGRSAHGQMLWYLRRATESSGTPDRPGGDPATPSPLRGNGHSLQP